MFSECRLGGLEAPTVEDSWDGSELANSVPLDSKETLLSFISNLKDLARRPPRLTMGSA